MTKYVVVEDVIFKTSQGKQEIRKGQVIRLPEEPARQLMQKGKVRPLNSADLFTEIFDNAVNEINAMFKPGTLDYARKQFPKTYQKGIEVENRINSLWREGTDINTFKLAVNEWRDIELQLIKLFQYKQ